MNNVNLDLYKTFYVVAKNKSMTKASEELMISQPAISKSIKTLEGQIGGVLFNRSNKGLELTEEGKMLYDRIKPALELIKTAENDFTEFQKLNTGEIKIGISSVLTKCLLLETLSTFNLKYPKIKITIVNGLTCDLINQLNEGKLDFVIYNESDIQEKNVEIKFLTSLRYVFFANSKYFDINENENIVLKYPLILQNQSSNTRKFLDKHMSNLKPHMEVVSQDLICSLVDIGLGVGFAFEKIVDMNGKFKKVYPLMKTNIFLAKNKNTSLSFAAKTFVKELQEELTNN